MKTHFKMATTFFSASLALAVVLTMATSAVAVPILNAYYDPANGNIKLQNITSSTQAILNFAILAFGDDTIRATEPGLPKLPTIPEIYPTYPPGYSGVSAGNVATPFLTLAPYPGWSPLSPIGPGGSYWDLGNIAVLGMTQADLDTRFLTDPESTPPGFDTSLYGQFLFSYQTSPGVFSSTTPGDVVAVPEPSTLAIAAVAAGFGGFGAVSRRRKKAAANARSLSLNA